MTNILLRIPKLRKDELQASLAEYEETASDHDMLHYFRVSHPPMNAGPGDKAYVLIDGQIIGYHLIEEIRYVGPWEAHDLFGGEWLPGYYIIRRANSWHPLEPTIRYSHTKGQWSWRYMREVI